MLVGHFFKFSKSHRQVSMLLMCSKSLLEPCYMALGLSAIVYSSRIVKFLRNERNDVSIAQGCQVCGTKPAQWYSKLNQLGCRRNGLLKSLFGELHFQKNILRQQYKSSPISWEKHGLGNTAIDFTIYSFTSKCSVYFPVLCFNLRHRHLSVVRTC